MSHGLCREGKKKNQEVRKVFQKHSGALDLTGKEELLSLRDGHHGSAYSGQWLTYREQGSKRGENGVGSNCEDLQMSIKRICFWYLRKCEDI